MIFLDSGFLRDAGITVGMRELRFEATVTVLRQAQDERRHVNLTTSGEIYSAYGALWRREL